MIGFHQLLLPNILVSLGAFDFSASYFIIRNFLQSFPLVLSSSGVATLAGYRPLNSDCVVVLPKHTNVWVITASSYFALFTKVLLNWILTEALSQNKLHSFLQKEFCCLNNRMDFYFVALIYLP